MCGSPHSREQACALGVLTCLLQHQVSRNTRLITVAAARTAHIAHNGFNITNESNMPQQRNDSSAQKVRSHCDGSWGGAGWCGASHDCSCFSWGCRGHGEVHIPLGCSGSAPGSHKPLFVLAIMLCKRILHVLFFMLLLLLLLLLLRAHYHEVMVQPSLCANRAR